MSANSTHSAHNSAPEAAPEAPQTPSTRPLWTLDSPFFDNLTMSAIVLDQLQKHIRFQAGPLHYLHGKDKTPVLDQYSAIDAQAQQEDFMEKFRLSEPDIAIFLIGHIFEHIGLPKTTGIMRFNVALAETAFVWLFQAMRIHPSFIECLNYLIGHFAVFTTYAEDHKTAEFVHIIVKVPPVGHLEAAFYVQYNMRTKKNIVIVAGNDLDGHLEMLAEHIQRASPPYDPFAIVLTIIKRYFRFLEAQRLEVDHAVIMTERETGRGAVAYSDGTAAKSVSPQNFDLTFMHWIEGNQRNVVYGSQFQDKLAAFVIAEHLIFIRHRDGVVVEVHDLTRRDRAIHERLKFHESMVKGLLEWCYVIRERIQRQLSAADSIINQFDNKVSIRNAETSTKIAEASRRIAEETRRDSTSMKTIASLTMIYLPSTFAASVFSTGFFSYNLQGTNLVKVNPQIWKLFVVALTLSVVTIAVWVLLNKNGVPRIFDWARQDPGSHSKDSPSTLASHMASGALVGDDRPVSMDANAVKENISVPKISLPVGIPEEVA